MKKSERIDFIKITEKLVKPEKVSKLFKNAEVLSKLPIRIQKKIMQMGSKKDPFISFIVEPYSLFLAYEIVDVNQINSLLPEDYELIKTSIFTDCEERYYVIMGAFNVHTSVFWGNRLEVYIIARNKKTNLISWIIHDYETNTISYDPGRGFVPPTTEHSVLTTSFAGEIIVDIESKISKNRLMLNVDLNGSCSKELNQRLWIEGNFSVDYSNELNDVQTKPFGLIFDPDEMVQALEISNKNLDVKCNSILNGIIASEPSEICVFPYAQHFYTTAMPLENEVHEKDDLEKTIKRINNENKNQHNCLGYCYQYGCKGNCWIEKK
ncbi:MAG: hypothetical protein JXR88_01750 [Clostridia bacterium]|nr:hypothetical protein [Clostridia bacterium]